MATENKIPEQDVFAVIITHPATGQRCVLELTLKPEEGTLQIEGNREGLDLETPQAQIMSMFAKRFIDALNHIDGQPEDEG